MPTSVGINTAEDNGYNDSAEHGHRPPPVNMHVPTSMYTIVYICVQQGFLTWYK